MNRVSPPPTPHPVEFKPLRSAPTEFNDHRNLFCHAYSSCLDRAFRLGWEDFSCAQCELRHANSTPRAASYALNQPHGSGTS
jgi:hypothetical protein